MKRVRWRAGRISSLVSRGVPINDVARVLGHSQITTTLNRYTYVLLNPENRITARLMTFC